MYKITQICMTLWLCFGAATVWSSPMAVSPVIVRLDLNKDFSFVDISNRGEFSTGAEIEVSKVEWKDGQESYSPTKDFLVSPPSFRLGEGKSRLIRFKFTGQRKETEQFYRLFIRQLPNLQAPNQINMIFTIGVPIFVEPTITRRALSIQSLANEQYKLVNTGNVTLTLQHIEGVSCADGEIKIGSRLAPSQELAIQPKAAACITKAKTEQGYVEIDVNAVSKTSK